MVPLLPFGEGGHMCCISCSVKLNGSVYFTLYLHVAHVPGGGFASLLQHWSCYKKLVPCLFHFSGPKGSVVCSKGIVSVWQQTQEAVNERESKGMSCPEPALLATPSLGGDYQEQNSISTEAACFRLSQRSEEPLVYSVAMLMQVFQFISLSVQKRLPVLNYSSDISEC